MADIFISFIHEEVAYAEVVRTFVALSLNTNVMPFVATDKFQIYAGELWLERIFEELRSAKVVILMLSTHSVQRPWVNFEAGAAWFNHAAVIPVCFGGLTKGTLPKPYSSLQGVDLEEIADQKYLAKSIAHHLQIKEPNFYRWSENMGKGLTGIAKDSAKRSADNALIALDILNDRLAEMKNENKEPNS